MQTLRTMWLALAASMVPGCSGSNTATPPPPPAQSSFAGTYPTRVTLVQSGCGPVTVQDNPTVVAHVPETSSLTLTHAGQEYAGTVSATGRFTTAPRAVDVQDGFIYAIAITGQFAGTGFAADVTVDRTGNGSAPCRYTVHWVGMPG